MARHKPPVHDDEDIEAPSKSARKRHMTALQELGEALTELSDKQLASVPIDDERLLLAIRESRRIRQHGAKRRHLQYIGKLMRAIEAEPVAAALAALDNPPPAVDKLRAYWGEDSGAD